jgi:uncharacterized protein YrrD
MLDREEFVKTHPDVRTGMTVFSTTGEKLGVIEQIGDDNIMIEKGRIFHKDFSVPFDDIEDVRGDEVIIRSRAKVKSGRRRANPALPVSMLVRKKRGRENTSAAARKSKPGFPSGKRSSRRRSARKKARS